MKTSRISTYLATVGPAIVGNYLGDKQKRIKKDIVPLGDEEIVYGQWISYTFDQDQTEKDGCFNPITNRVCTAR